jgi:Ca-activated chloride channel family protein
VPTPGNSPASTSNWTTASCKCWCWRSAARTAAIIHDASGQPRTDANGRPALGSFDQAALKQLASAVDAPLGSLTLNDDDLDWIELHAQQHFQSASAEQRELHWKDAGYWLCWPLLLLALVSVRKGWSVNWMAGLALAVGLGWPCRHRRKPTD